MVSCWWWAARNATSVITKVPILFCNAVPHTLFKRKALNSHKKMNKQAEQSSLQLLVDNDICRIKAEQPNVSFQDIANVINARHETYFTSSDIIAHWQLIQRRKETTAAIFSEFQRHEIDFTAISQRTDASVSQVRKEVMRGLVNNIYKVCIIVRKRSISKLSKNFISPRNIKNLVALILKPANFHNVKQEYSILWNFISRNHQETYFRTVSDENYKMIYRQLIILAETYKINDNLDDDVNDIGFQRSILNQSNYPISDPFALLNDFRNKKNQQYTIDLVSSEEEEHIEQQPAAAELTVEQLKKFNSQDQHAQNENYLGRRMMEQLVELYSVMSELQHMESEGSSLKEDMSRVAVKICSMEFLIGLI